MLASFGTLARKTICSSRGRAWICLLVLLFVLALTWVSAQAQDADERALRGTADNPVASIPLGPEQTGVDLAATVALSFKVRGEKGDEFVSFELTGSDPSTTVPAGTIFDSLPLGIATEWRQAILEITPAMAATLPQATSLRVRFLNGGEGLIYLRDLLVIPRLPGSEGWHTLAVALRDFDAPELENISTLVLDSLEGGRARVEKIVQEPREAAALQPPGPPRPGRIPDFQEGYYRVADFDGGQSNHGKGSFGVFQRAPSEARMDLDVRVRRGDGGSSLRLEYDRQDEGYCGLWVYLPEGGNDSTERVYLNASPFPYLSFWIKGLRGGEDVTVHIADHAWHLKDSALPLASLSELLPQGVSREWQEVIVPLAPAQEQGLDLTRLASLSFHFSASGAGTVFIDDLAFKTSQTAFVPPTAPPPRARAGRTLRRATWIWDPTKFLENPDEQQELFRFSRRHSINVFFVQISCHYRQVGEEKVCELDREDEFRTFIREARRHGIEVHALDGYRYHVLPRWHPQVLAQVRAVLDFNARVPPEERFAGIHHDNEPYLIPAFSGRLREDLLAYFLDLAAACQQLIRQNSDSLVYGVDIPFWYDSHEVTWRGVRKPMSEHVIDIVDLVGIMAYRTDALGANGVIALASDETAYASRLGKQVFVALETSALPDQVSYTFADGNRVAESLASEARSQTYLVIEERDGAAILYWKEFHARPGDDAPLLRESLATDGQRRLFLSIEKSVVPASMLSFAGYEAKALEAVVARVQDAFQESAGFAGVAIHDYESYWRLSRQTASTSSR